MTNDPISDLIIRIKNASMRGLRSVSIPYSRMKESVLAVLEKEGYVSNVSSSDKKDSLKQLNFDVLYREDGEPVVNAVRRISKPSRRIYKGARELRSDREGVTVISTSKGVKTLRDAREEGVGGEVLFKIR